ncbi:MAG: 2-hydroxychromene-2-carboxylate isomerase [Candidatus Binataceae bacterium]
MTKKRLTAGQKFKTLSKIQTGTGLGMELEYFFDYGSPFSYLADTQLGKIAAHTGASIVYRPVLLGALIKETGNISPAGVPAKLRYYGAEFARWSRRYGVPFVMNPHFPHTTLQLMRAAIVSQDLNIFPAYHRAVFTAYWAEGRKLADEAVLRDVLTRASLPADEIIGLSASQPIKDRLREVTSDAIRRGVFGVPTFFVGDEMYWGNDRLDFVEAALSGKS